METESLIFQCTVLGVTVKLKIGKNSPSLLRDFSQIGDVRQVYGMGYKPSHDKEKL